MKHIIWVEVKTTNKSRLLLKLFKTGVTVLSVHYNDDKIILQILASDYKKLKRLVGYKFYKVKEDGLFGLKALLKSKWLIFLGVILFVILIFFFSNIIVSVQVIHSNQEIRLLVSKAMDEYGIKKLTWKKDFQEIEEIKKKILNDYPNDLEWLEIETHGMKYVIRVEERIITDKVEEKESCHLVANKSAVVKKLIYSRGEAKVLVNDFVSEGDILVSGELIANEKVTGVVCAEGDVFGEVWYTTSVSLPVMYEEKIETGKNRWNVGLTKGDMDYYIFKPRLVNYINENYHLFSIFDYEVSFIVQKEVRVDVKEYTESEALEEALRLVDEKIKMKLKDGEEIISKKVLKKSVNDSTMDVEVFVSVLENISRQQEFQRIEEG